MEKDLLNFVEKVKDVLGDNLKSFIVYGSAATGEHYSTSDYNTLMIVSSLSVNDMDALSPHVVSWVKKNNPPPLIFTKESLFTSEDVFPMEFLDIKDNRMVVFGEDIFRDLVVPEKNLREEIERELKSKLLRLRQAYILTGGKEQEIIKLMTDSVSTFTAVLKGLLRLFGEKPPSKKKDIILMVPDKAGINREFFIKILSVKESGGKAAKGEALPMFEQYLQEIEKLADYVDKYGG